MEITVRVIYEAKLKLCKVNDGPWMPSWNVISNTNISDFGFNLVGNSVEIASNFKLLNIKPLNYPEQFQMIIVDKTATFVDYFNNNFNNKVTFVFDITYQTNDVECEDILGNTVTHFSFDEDGIVYGSSDMSPNKRSISAECCASLGYDFDSNAAKCYWSKPCEIDDVIKVIINSDGDDGSLFQVDDNSNCTLEVEFDYLLEYDCNKLLSCVGSNRIIDTLSGVTVHMTLERVSPITYYNETVYEAILFKGDDILNYFQESNSGVFLNGNNCNTVVNRIKNELGINSSIISTTSLFSNWMRFKVNIVDESFLTSITNEKIKLGFKIFNSSCDMSLLLDNISLNRLCQIIETNEVVVNSCPSFELSRVIDNKKSWVAKDVFDNREFNLSRRETDYNINHHKLGINSKEVDLNINPARAIETDVMNSVLNIPCLLTTPTDIAELLTTDLLSSAFTLEEFKNILTSELIDAKSRKTISNYPVLRMLYDRYLNSLENCGIATNAFNYDQMDDFINLIGNYWVDLIEQVIPSTTIWGATYKYNNTIFDNNKIKYRKGSLFVCTPPQGFTIIGSEPQIEVSKTILSLNDSDTSEEVVETCNGVYMVQINDGSEFIGSVKIVGSNVGNTDGGDIIILNETLE